MKVLIVGVGSIGERHLRCFMRAGATGLGICEVNPALRDAMAAKYNVSATFATLDDALGAGFRAAVIATPANTHIPIAQQLAEAGLHLLIEKPLSTSNDGLAELSLTLQQRRLVVGVGYVYRAHPMFAAFHDAVSGAEFGPPLRL